MKRSLPYYGFILAAAFLLGGSISLSATKSYGAGLGVNFLNPKRVDADPKKTYPLEQNNGPWVIMVARFSGENADVKANKLVYELRKRYKLNAYVYDKKFEFKVDEGMRPTEKKQYKNDKYAKKTVKEYAVLVGDFQSADEEDYKKALKTIKSSVPNCLKAEIVQVGANMKPPLAGAFGTTNPMLPPDLINKRGYVDSFVERLNSDSKFSLLNCPERFTVRVATFTGYTEIDQEKVRQVLSGKEELDGKVLREAGINATKLCAALREKGYRAYEFHDRYSSIVTVGGFNEVGTMGPQGLIELNPEIARIYNTFKAKYRGDQNAASFQKSEHEKLLPYMPQQLVDIEFDLQPQVIMVPKRFK